MFHICKWSNWTWALFFPRGAHIDRFKWIKYRKKKFISEYFSRECFNLYRASEVLKEKCQK